MEKLSEDEMMMVVYQLTTLKDIQNVCQSSDSWTRFYNNNKILIFKHVLEKEYNLFIPDEFLIHIEELLTYVSTNMIHPCDNYDLNSIYGRLRTFYVEMYNVFAHGTLQMVRQFGEIHGQRVFNAKYPCYLTTPFITVCQRNDDEEAIPILTYLRSMYVDIDAQDLAGQSCLWFIDNVHIMEVVLQWVNTHLRDSLGYIYLQTLMNIEFPDHRFELLKLYMKMKPYDLNLIDKIEQTATPFVLSFLIQQKYLVPTIETVFNYLEGVQYPLSLPLIDYFIEHNIVSLNSIHNGRPLIFQVYMTAFFNPASRPVLLELLRRGANPYIKDEYEEQTLAEFAKHYNDIDVVFLLDELHTTQ